jgi:predicted nucleic acid-binding protein
VVLVDTSVWIEHFRHGENRLAELLLPPSVLTHPFVIGELACGTFRHRTQVLGNLALLPSAVAATDDEVLELIEHCKLWGRGIGWIDAHLLASALLSHCPIWSFDQKLDAAAEHVGVGGFH